MKKLQGEDSKSKKHGHKPSGFVSRYAAKQLAKKKVGHSDGNSIHPNQVIGEFEQRPQDSVYSIPNQDGVISAWPVPDIHTVINRCLFIVLQSEAPRPVVLTIQGDFSGHSVELPRYNNYATGRFKCEDTCRFALPKILSKLADRKSPESDLVCIAGNHYQSSSSDVKRIWCLASAQLDPTRHSWAIRGARAIVQWELLCPDLIGVMKPSHAMPIIYVADFLKIVFPGNNLYFDELSRAAGDRHKKFLEEQKQGAV